MAQCLEPKRHLCPAQHTWKSPLCYSELSSCFHTPVPPLCTSSCPSSLCLGAQSPSVPPSRLGSGLTTQGLCSFPSPLHLLTLLDESPVQSKPLTDRELSRARAVAPPPPGTGTSPARCPVPSQAAVNCEESRGAWP